MLVTFENGKFIAKCKFAERNIFKNAGFSFKLQPTGKWRWQTTNAYIALRFKSSFDKLAQQEVERLTQQVAESTSVTPTKRYEPPAGLSYKEYQHVGIKWIIDHPRCLLGDDMGVGKTIQVIGAINELRPKRVLIVAPASLSVNWERELNKWLTFKRTIGICYNKVVPATDFVITTYGRAKDPYLTTYEHIPWDMLVCDEAHKLKNPETHAARCFLSLEAKRMVFMTGTPMLNRPIELHSLLYHMEPEFWSRRIVYAQRYCDSFVDPRGNWNHSGTSNAGELQFHLRSRCMIRRTKAQVLPQLPEKIRQVVPLDLRDMDDKIRKGLDEVKKSKNKEELFGKLAKLRNECAHYKSGPAIEHIKELLRLQRKVVVFAHHTRIMDKLFKKLAKYNPARVDGSTVDRMAEVDKFEQGDQGCRVFIGQLQAAGVGLNLTSCSCVVFVELDWVPGNITQAEDRCHRLGQEWPVLVQHLVVRGSFDDLLLESIIKKQENIEKCLDDNSEFDWLAELKKAIKE